MDENIVYIYHSPMQDSWSNYGTKFYFEYAIQLVDDSEKDDLYSKFGFKNVYTGKTYKALKRRVNISSDNEISYNDWNLIDVCQSELKAALSFSDSHYSNQSGTSLHYLYDESIRIHNKRHTLNQELENLQDLITPHKFQAYSNLQTIYRDKLNQALKDRRLYSKAQKGLVNSDIMAEIMNPIKSEYKNEYNRITARIEEIESELKELYL